MFPINSLPPALFSRSFLFVWIACVAVFLIEFVVFSIRASEGLRWQTTPRLQLTIPELTTIEIEETKGGEAIASSFRFTELSERLESIDGQLAFSNGVCGIFAAEQGSMKSGSVLEVFYLEYEAGNSRFIHDVFGHAPEVCMSASGATLVRAYEDRMVEVDGSSIPVRVLEFSAPQTVGPLWIFKLTWIPADAPIRAATDSSFRLEKIQAGLVSNPRPPARVILVGARNFDSVEVAWNAYRGLIEQNLSMELPN